MSELRVLLVGLPGVGKSELGRALSARTGWPYLDNQQLLALVTDRGYDEEVAEGGLEAQTRIDSEALTEAVTAEPPVIAEVPAGVVEATYDRARLEQGGYVVWVSAPPRVAAAHLGDDGSDPAWAGDDPVATLSELEEERNDLYALVADLTIDVSVLSPDEAAERVLAALEDEQLYSTG